MWLLTIFSFHAHNMVPSLPSVQTGNDITGDFNLLLSRHEHQDVPHGRLEVYLNHLPHGTLHIVLTRVATEHDVHWESAAGDLRGEEGRGGEEGGKEREEEGGEGERENMRERGGRQGCLSKEERCVGSDYVTVKVGTFPKKVANFSASMVADVTISFMSFRRDTTWGKIKHSILEVY